MPPGSCEAPTFKAPDDSDATFAGMAGPGAEREPDQTTLV
jgi:hypothetical protein